MSLPYYAAICFLLLFSACESPQDKISRLQNELLKALGERDYFEIKLEKQKLLLPLPPSPELAEARKISVSEINLESNSIKPDKLNEDDRQRLVLLQTQLNEIVKRGNGAFFDPAKCVLSNELCANLQQNASSSDDILLQKIPEYYAEVERRWQMPDPKRARLAAEQSLLILDELEKTGEHSEPVRLAVKDFISLCHSSVLLH